MKSYFYKIPETNCIPELLTDSEYTSIRYFLNNVKLRDYQIKRDLRELLKTVTKKNAYTILVSKYNLTRYNLRKKTYPFLT